MKRGRPAHFMARACRSEVSWWTCSGPRIFRDSPVPPWRSKRMTPPTLMSHTSDWSSSLPSTCVPPNPTSKSSATGRGGGGLPRPPPSGCRASRRVSCDRAGTRADCPERHGKIVTRCGIVTKTWSPSSSRRVRDSGMGYQTVILESGEGIATLTLNRPEARNALDVIMREELVEAFDEIEGDPRARVVILTGAGGHFCAGGDVKSMRQKHSAPEGRARVELLNRFVLRLFNFPKPVIAMVDGFAVGAGCNIALGCDMIVASDRARFGEVFLKIGLVPDGGGTWLLQRLVGLAKAKELVLTAEIIDAAEALRIGLVNRVVPAADLESATRGLAARIAAGPPIAASLAKSLLNRAATVDLAAALEGEAFGQSNAITSEDHAEGVRAFLEKRPAKFQGR